MFYILIIYDVHFEGWFCFDFFETGSQSAALAVLELTIQSSLSGLELTEIHLPLPLRARIKVVGHYTWLFRLLSWLFRVDSVHVCDLPSHMCGEEHMGHVLV